MTFFGRRWAGVSVVYFLRKAVWYVSYQPYQECNSHCGLADADTTRTKGFAMTVKYRPRFVSVAHMY